MAKQGKHKSLNIQGEERGTIYIPVDPEGKKIPGETHTRSTKKIGRNELCPCGSGKKFKKCHEGREEELEVLLALQEEEQ